METSILWQTPQVLAGRSWFYRDFGASLPRRSVGIVVCEAALLGDGNIILRATPNSAVGALGLGALLQGATKAVEITCAAAGANAGALRWFDEYRGRPEALRGAGWA